MLVKLHKSETVASVAKRYKLTVASVADWNKVAVGGTFKAKQSIVLYLPAKAKTTSRHVGKGDKGTKLSRASKRK
jgi:membrane-bound lytic murein transglycosylase D